MPRPRFAPIIAVGCLMLALSVAPARAQHVVALVNGEPITSLDVQTRAKLIQLSSQKAPSRKEVIEQLVEEKLKLREAKRYGLEPGKTEVNRAFASMAKRMGTTEAELAKRLSSAGSSADTLKQRIGTEIVWGNLVRGRYQSSLEVADRKVVVAGVDDASATPSFQYTLRPILIVVPRGTPRERVEAKRREAEALRQRFQDCETGLPLARALRDVAVREPVIRSAGELSPQLRKILDEVPIGRLTAPETTANGIEMFALCAKKETTEDSPQMREARNKAFAEKFEEKSKSYLAEIRRSALVEYRE